MIDYVFELLFGRNTLSTAHTCLTLCSIKAWCTTAVKSVHLVCTGPVVLTGMTCAVINIYLRRLGEKSVGNLNEMVVDIFERAGNSNCNNNSFSVKLQTHSHIN